MALPQENEYFTYADYLTWDDGNRYELIDGYAYLMSPAPSFLHQEVLVNLLTKLANHLEGKPCKALPAPLDVRLNPEGDDDTVVQPDITVICDESKITKDGIVGAPNLVVEILSPSTAVYDRVVKMQKYLKFAVPEYWIVDPELKTIQVHLLRGNEYIIRVYAIGNTIESEALPGFCFDPTAIFP